MAAAEPPVQDLDSTINLESFGSEYEEKALVLQGEVALVKIENDEQWQKVATAGLDASANIRAITAYLEPLKTQRYAAWKRVCDVLTSKTDPFEAVKAKASRLVAAYQYEQQQKREAEEAAERKRLAREEETIRAQQAEQLAKEDRVEDGLALLESPTVTSAPVAAITQMPVARGVSAPAERYHAVVTDLMTLVKAVAAGQVPLFALKADEVFLNAQARSMKQLLSYPGVKVEREFKSSFRPK